MTMTETPQYAQAVLDGYDTLAATESWPFLPGAVRSAAGEIRNLATDVLHPDSGKDERAQLEFLQDLLHRLSDASGTHMIDVVDTFRRAADELHTHLNYVHVPD